MTKKKIAKGDFQLYDSSDQDDFFDEIIEGVRYEMKPSPVVIHQVVSSDIQYLLKGTCKTSGVILVAPVDVYFDKDNRFIPDVVYVSNKNLDIIKKNRIEGSPDLIVEILSPSTSKNDRQRKKTVYERFKVGEYWIVDTHHYTIEQYILENSIYQLHQTYSFGDTLTSSTISCIHLPIDDVFEDAVRFSEHFNRR
ncbi:Uma2 family endonuclease [Bacillus sp. DJP31]|uniref:Uma2 family endonuclease n=1 Tax=Bacillus sp. DJP31 TaxID=3409789 RepID=UPI003BB76AA4